MNRRGFGVALAVAVVGLGCQSPHQKAATMRADRAAHEAALDAERDEANARSLARHEQHQQAKQEQEQQDREDAKARDIEEKRRASDAAKRSEFADAFWQESYQVDRQLMRMDPPVTVLTSEVVPDAIGVPHVSFLLFNGAWNSGPIAAVEYEVVVMDAFGKRLRCQMPGKKACAGGLGALKARKEAQIDELGAVGPDSLIGYHEPARTSVTVTRVRWGDGSEWRGKSPQLHDPTASDADNKAAGAAWRERMRGWRAAIAHAVVDNAIATEVRGGLDDAGAEALRAKIWAAWQQHCAGTPAGDLDDGRVTLGDMCQAVGTPPK